MFKYTITQKLLRNLKKITQVITELESKRFSQPVLAKYELVANSLSAHSSTSIEGNPLPLTEVKKIIKSRPSQIRVSEREVLNYNDCLVWLNQSLRDASSQFNLKLILQIHYKVMNGLLSKDCVGKIRNEPVFVNNPQKRKTIYWPPDHDHVLKLMNELVQYITENENEVDSILLAGLFHKQFVVIHPFVDGNGRTVRLATKFLLAKMGLNTFHLFSFENYYNKNVSKYFENVGVLGNYYDIKKQIDFTNWLEYFTDGILDELLRVTKELESISATPEQFLNSELEKIINYISKVGFIRDRDYSKLTDRAKATRTQDFNKLISFGLIEKHGRGPAVYYKLKANN